MKLPVLKSFKALMVIAAAVAFVAGTFIPLSALAQILPGTLFIKQYAIGVQDPIATAVVAPSGSMNAPLGISINGSVFELYYSPYNEALDAATVLPFNGQASIRAISLDVEASGNGVGNPTARTRVAVPYTLNYTVSGMVAEGSPGAEQADMFLALNRQVNPSLNFISNPAWVPSSGTSPTLVPNGIYTSQVMPENSAGGYGERWTLELMASGSVGSTAIATSNAVAVLPVPSPVDFPVLSRYTSAVQMVAPVTMNAANLYPLCRFVMTVQGPLDTEPRILDDRILIGVALIEPTTASKAVDLTSVFSISGEYKFEWWCKIPLVAPLAGTGVPPISNPEQPLNSPPLITQAGSWVWEKLGEKTVTVAYDVRVNANITTQ